MKEIETVLEIGVPKPFSVLHMSDTHLTYADERDNERKRALAKDRTATFLHERCSETAEDMLAQGIKLCTESGLPLIYTGDLIDFTSEANFEAGRDFVKATNCFFAVGNHEFSKYVGEAWEDEVYKADSAERVRKMVGGNFSVTSRIIGGVNFVAIDNNYYRFTEKQLDDLKKEVEKGLPIILAMHNPLYERELYDFMMKRSGCAYAVATPEGLMSGYSDYRYRQQLADSATLEAAEYIKNEPTVRAIIAGHLHVDYEGTVAEGLPQIVTGFNTIRKIKIV